MNPFIPTIEIELQKADGEKVVRKLRHDARAQRLFTELEKKTPSVSEFDTAPRLLWALTRWEGKDEKPEDFDEFIGGANLEFFLSKLDEATGERFRLVENFRRAVEPAERPQMAKANGVAPLTGTNSKPSPAPNGDSASTSSTN